MIPATKAYRPSSSTIQACLDPCITLVTSMQHPLSILIIPYGRGSLPKYFCSHNIANARYPRSSFKKTLDTRCTCDSLRQTNTFPNYTTPKKFGQCSKETSQIHWWSLGGSHMGSRDPQQTRQYNPYPLGCRAPLLGKPELCDGFGV